MTPNGGKLQTIIIIIEIIKLKDMQYFKTISELIASYKILAYPGRIYSKLNGKSDLTNSQYWILSSKEQKDEDMIEVDGECVPESVAPYHAKSFLSVGTFQDIIEVKLSNNPNLSVNMDADVFIEAINYYLENDDFMD